MARMSSLIAIGAVLVALGCSRPLTPEDAGTSGGAGVRIMTSGGGGVASGAAGAGASGEAGASGSAGANGGGSAGSAGDPGPDPSCADQCGKVHGVGINGSCRYTLPCRLPGSFTGMVVFINGEMVAEDPSRTNGWEFNFTDPSQTTFQFFGQACADVTSSGASLDIDYLCELAAP